MYKNRAKAILQRRRRHSWNLCHRLRRHRSRPHDQSGRIGFLLHRHRTLGGELPRRAESRPGGKGNGHHRDRARHSNRGPLDFARARLRCDGNCRPRVHSIEQAQSVVDSMKFPPMGMRGYGLRSIIHDYDFAGAEAEMRSSDDETMVVLQMESKECVDAIYDITAIPGVDATMVGPLRFIGLPRHPRRFRKPHLLGRLRPHGRRLQQERRRTRRPYGQHKNAKAGARARGALFGRRQRPLHDAERAGKRPVKTSRRLKWLRQSKGTCSWPTGREVGAGFRVDHTRFMT